MRYPGGKQRLGKTIAGFVELYAKRHRAVTYGEPFCGMFGVGRHVFTMLRFARDIHPDLILLLQGLQKGWTPPGHVSEAEYKALKRDRPSALRGFAGFCCSFGGRWFEGYARDSVGTNYAASQRPSAISLAESLQTVEIEQGDYRDATAYDITYCDPPYSNTKPYSGTDPFRSDDFWEWVRQRDGVTLVSEYHAPDWMKCIWSRTVRSTIKRDAAAGDAANERVEKLFLKEN